jgi:hypothetical protein
VFRKEGDVAVADAKRVGGKIDAGLVALEHIQAEKKVHRLSLKDGQRNRKEEASESDLRRMDTS